MVLPDPGKLGGGELPAFGVQNPYPIICPKFVIWDRCGWHRCPKHSLWRAFVDGVIDNDEKVDKTKKKHTQFKIRVQKPYSIYQVFKTKLDALFMTETADWKPYPLGPHIPI